MSLRAVGQRCHLARVADPRTQLSGFNVGLVLAAIYFALYLLAPVDIVLWLWTPVAIVVTMASPVAGLTVLAAIGSFTEALSADGRITPSPVLVAVFGISVALRLIVTRPMPRPSLPIVLALAVFVGTALGVVSTWIVGGPVLGTRSAQLWVPGIGGAVTVMVGAAWVGWRGEIGPFVVGVTSVVVGAVLSVVDYETRGAVHVSVFGPLLRSPDWLDWSRLFGVIPAPNATAAIFMVGFAPCLVVALLTSHRALRGIALVGSAITFVAIVLTYSRSGLLAAGTVVAAAVWVRWRLQGLLITIAVLGVCFGLMISAGLLRDVPVAVDQDRVLAWVAAIRVWLSAPISGAGFRMFEWVHAYFGTPLTAPHNEWLRLLAEEGLYVGVAGFAFAVLTPIALLRNGGLVATAAGAAAAGVFVIACFNNPFIYAQVNVVAFAVIGVGLGVALARTPAPTVLRTRNEPGRIHREVIPGETG